MLDAAVAGQFDELRSPRTHARLSQSPSCFESKRKLQTMCRVDGSRAHLKPAPSAKCVDLTRMSEGYDEHDDTPRGLLAHEVRKRAGGGYEGDRQVTRYLASQAI